MSATQATNTIKALVGQLKADAQRIAQATVEAETAMEESNRNGAIGALLSAEAEIDRIEKIFRTTLTLHRSP